MEAGIERNDGVRSVETPPSDNLQRIHLISPVIEKSLKEMGYRTYSDIANLSEAEILEIQATLFQCQPVVSEQCWLEQAEILAGGGTTAFAYRYDRLPN